MISWRGSSSSLWDRDTLLLCALRGLALGSAALVVLIAIFVAHEAFPLLRDVPLMRLFTDPSWHPLEERYNLAPMLVGTVLVSAGALVLATPLGLASAIFCNFYAPTIVARGLRAVLELLAGIPSVVYGLWGLVVLVPLIGRLRPPGASLLAGCLVLALMILPTLAMAADTALARIPRDYLRGAASLGLSRWTTVWGVALPAARRGILTGALLQAGRAIGETMAVLMVCGNIVQVPGGLLEPVRTLTANIALEMAYAMGHHRAALFVSGLILLLMVLVLVMGAERVAREQRHG
jgi:phosphate transport system permease protein